MQIKELIVSFAVACVCSAVFSFTGMAAPAEATAEVSSETVETEAAVSEVLVEISGPAEEILAAKEAEEAAASAAAAEQAAAEAAAQAEVQKAALGAQISSFALQFVGNPYRYGGTSLTGGADCSGFVQSVFRNFGISLPRSSSQQKYSGIEIGSLENAQPGDILVYSGHVGIYMGNNQLVHASNSREGIKVSPATYSRILSIRRVI